MVNHLLDCWPPFLPLKNKQNNIFQSCIEFPFLLFEIEFDTHNFSQKQEQQRVPFSCCLRIISGKRFNGFRWQTFHQQLSMVSCVLRVLFAQKQSAPYYRQTRQTNNSIESELVLRISTHGLLLPFFDSFFFLYVSLYLYMMILCYSILKIEMYYCIEQQQTLIRYIYILTPLCISYLFLSDK